MKTYIVGRSPYADIVIADPSVAEYHAEIVMADDGRVFVGDCGSASGTWAREASGWQPLRQAFVAMDDTLRFGDHECALTEILAPVLPNPRPASIGTARETVRTGGRLSRDPWTGEIVRRGR